MSQRLKILLSTKAERDCCKELSLPQWDINKTSSRYGPTTLALEKSDVFLFREYLTKTCPLIDTEADCVLVTERGPPLMHYRDHTAALCCIFGLTIMPTPTEVYPLCQSIPAYRSNCGPYQDSPGMAPPMCRVPLCQNIPK